MTLPTTYGLPTCGQVDQDGIYVTYAKRAVYRHDLSGGSTTHVMNSAEDVNGLLTDGSRLFINQSDQNYARFVSVNKSTGAIIDTFENYIDSVHGASIAPAIRKIFGRSTGVSPSDITYVSYDAAGNLLSGGNSPNHGDYPDATKTWVFPSETRVADSSGTLYTTDTLQYAGSLGTRVDDIQFPADSGPIVVRGSSMTAYSSGLLPGVSATLPFAPASFYLNAADAVIFGTDKTQPNGIRVAAVPLSTLGTPVLSGVDPTNLTYVPDNVFVSNDGTLLLVSKAHKSVFRWSPETQGYLPTIPLANAPTHSAYSKAANVLYLADKKGVVRSVDLDDATPVEMPFAILPTEPLGLSVAGEYVFTADSSGAWCTHRTFSSAGAQISAKDWNYYSDEYIWSEASQKMYFFRDGTSPNDLLWEQVNASGSAYPGVAAGGIGDDLDTPLHGSAYFVHPIRVSPDGSVVILGSGAIFDANTLSKLPIALPTSVKDLVWHGGKIKTIRTVSGVAKLQSWGGATLALDASRDIPGTALRLFALDEERMLAVCMSSLGRPMFHVLGEDFEITPPSSLAAPAGLSITTPATGKLRLVWSDVSGELGYSVQRKPTASGDWEEIGKTGPDESAFQFDCFVANDTFAYRVVAFHGDLLSDPSAALENVVSGPPLPPEAFVIDAASVAKIKLKWTDGAMEDGYRLEFRRPGAAWKAVGFLAEDVASTSVGGLDSNSVYEFRVAARNPLGLSEWAFVEGKTKHGQGEIAVSLKGIRWQLKDHENGFDFGFSKAGTKGLASLRLVIRNVGKNELRQLRIKLGGPHPGDFKVSNLKRTGIRKGETVEVEIQFNARALGKRLAELHIYSSDANESPFDVLLLGEGVKNAFMNQEAVPVSKRTQHVNGLREFARGAGGVQAGEAAAFE